MQARPHIITGFFEYEDGDEFGWAITTDDGGILTLVVKDDGKINVTGKSSEPRHPNIIGATLNNWHFFKNIEEANPNHELVLILETSKGEVRLSVYNYYNSFTSDTLSAKVSWEYQI